MTKEDLFDKRSIRQGKMIWQKKTNSTRENLSDKEIDEMRENLSSERRLIQ